MTTRDWIECERDLYRNAILALAEAEASGGGLEAVLAATGRTLEVDLIEARLAEEPAAPLVRRAFWHHDGSRRDAAAAGEDLARRVRETGRPAWLAGPDATAASLAGGFAVPLGDNAGRRGALTFLARRPLAEDSRLVDAAETIAGLIARFDNEHRAREASDERYRELIERSPDAIVVTRGPQVLFTNRKALRLLGFERPTKLTTTTIASYIHPEDLERAMARAATIVAQGAEPEPSVFRLRVADGSYISMESIPRLIDWDGEPAVLAVLRDVSERRRQEAEIRRLASFPAQSPGPVLQFDRDSRLIYCNQASEPLLAHEGFVLGEPAGVAWRPLIEQAIAAGRPHDSELWCGEDCYLLIFAPVQNSCFVTVYGYDITARREAEESARQNERRLRDIALTASDWIWEMDANLRFTFVSERVRNLFSHGPEHFVGKTVQDVGFRLLAGGDDRPVDEIKAEPREVRSIEYAYTDPHQGERRLIVNAVPVFTENGSFGGFRGTAADVTEARAAEQRVQESEQRFRALISESTQGIIVLDRGKAIYANDAFARIHGYGKGEEIVGHSDIMSLVHPDDRDRMIEYFRRQMGGAASATEHFEFRGLRGDGSEVLLDVRTSRVPWGEREVACFNVSDVTEQRRLESQLRQSQKMESVGLLAGGIAHDFNNLLTVVLGSLELILTVGEAIDGQRLMRLAENARRAARRGTDLTQRLLAFSRTQSLDLRDCRVDKVVAGLEPLLARTLGEHIRLKTRSAAGLWQARTDVAQLESALINLAVNARDAMAQGGDLRIEATNVVLDDEQATRLEGLEPGAYVAIAVTDTGCGMSGDVLDHAFEPFFTTKGVGKGTGLGLSMVYGFVKQTGGHALIESEPGRGTTVRLHLPRAESMNEAAASTAAAPSEIDGGSETVLLVEDNEDVRETSEAMLRLLGYDVVTAANGPGALSLVDERDDIDLLFTDVVMAGGMDGVALALAVRERHPDLPVLFTSGYAAAELRRLGIDEIGGQWIRKPYTRRELGERLKETLGG